MSDVAQRLMTGDEFLEWCLDQEDTYELIDGRPVLKFDNGPEVMAGGTRHHAMVAANIIAALRPRLRGGPCVPVGGDLAVRVPTGRIRRPNVTVECAKGPGEDLDAREPTVLFEVLSRSTRGFDLVQKADEYRRLPTLKHFVLLEPGMARALLWSRDADGDWSPVEVTGVEAALELPGVGVSLPMAEVYEDVELVGAG